MNIFFCDLMGTFDGNKENRKESVERFTDNLKSICRALDIENLSFTFVTAEEMITLLPYIEEIKESFKNSPIKLGNQFSCDKEYCGGVISDIEHDNKLSQIYHYANKQNIKRIFFADDTMTQQKIIKSVINRKEPDIEFISIVPNNHQKSEDVYVSDKYGIEGLNEAVEGYINDLETSHKL